MHISNTGRVLKTAGQKLQQCIKTNHLVQLSSINAFDMFIHGYFTRDMSIYLLLHTTALNTVHHVVYT